MTQPKLFVVEDDPLLQQAIVCVAEEAGEIECFGSAEACQARLATQMPDLLLLDIGLPGMDGYAFCKLLKEDAATRALPVIFISGHDSIEERLAGYDAGAEDFIVKPFAPPELLRKVRVALQLHAERRALEEQLSSAEQLTSLALASMDEAGIVLQFTGKLIGWESGAEIAEGLLELARRLGVSAAVQVRLGSSKLTQSAQGRDLPLEVSILDHLQTKERIFEFGNRGVYNFDHVTIMISDMPLAEPDVCGRIRDNLAIAAQGADARLAALESQEARARSQQGLINTLNALKHTLMQFREAHEAHRLRTSGLAFELEEDMAKSFVHLGLTTGQERELEELIGSRIGELTQIVDQGEELQGILTRLLRELEGLSET